MICNLNDGNESRVEKVHSVPTKPRKYPEVVDYETESVSGI